MSVGPTDKQKRLSGLPSVDEVLKGAFGKAWLSAYPRRIVLQAVRETLSAMRKTILQGEPADTDLAAIIQIIDNTVRELSLFSLRPLINATGIVIHTNLGRAILSEKALSNVVRVSAGYSNLEYDLDSGKRGHRHVHANRLLKEITGAEEAFIVNNNAAAVLLCLGTLAKGKEVIVSRSELVEIGGAFRVPDVMAASGAVMREIGTTNKTHLKDYVDAINDNTALILKVHQSNYKIIGFTDDVKIGELTALGKKKRIPVMYDLGSGCLIDLKPYGIHSEPSVQEIVKAGIDILSFSGDKLLGGPQGGVIAGKKKYLERIRKNPLARAVRIDKLTLAAFEAVLMEYMDTDNAVREVPTLQMLLQSPEEIRAKAERIAAAVREKTGSKDIEPVKDISKAGGGSLPEAEFPTYAVAVRPSTISVNELELRLRKWSTPIIARIKGNTLMLDARTIRSQDMDTVEEALVAALSDGRSL